MAVYLERAVIRDHSETLLIVNFLSFQQQRQQAVRKATVCLHPLQVDNIFTFIHQVMVLFRHSNICVFIARWHLFQCVGYLRHQQQVDLLTLKVVSESRVTWATSVPILVFLDLSVLELGLMYATYKQTDVRQKHRLMPLSYGGGGIIN